MNLDTTKIRPVPVQATLLLVNNFIVNTTKFLNNFSESCEIKIANVSTKLNDLEITLSVLEAKLNSIPGLDGSYSSSDLPPATAAAATTNAPPPPQSSPPENSGTVPSPPAPPPPANDGIAVCDHPDYAEFFKLQRLGVPPPVIEGKMRAAGLDHTLLNSPNAMLPAAGGGALVVSADPLSRRIFNKYSNGGSTISVGQFHAMAAAHGVWLSGEMLAIALKMIDADGNGTIEYSEFLAWYKQSSFSALSLDDSALERRHKAAELFSKYDDDKSGVIDRGEFSGLHQELVMNSLTRHGVEKALEDMDSNADGKIQFNELVSWLERS